VVACFYAEISGKRAGMEQILFELNIDPSNSSIPHASIKADSRFSKSENEVLLSMHSVFRIDSVEELEPGLWMVTLSSTTDDDPELRSLNHCIQQEIGYERGWQAIGQLLTRMGHYDRAIEIYQTELDEMPENDRNEYVERLITYYNNIGVAHDGKGEYSAALSYYNQIQRIISEHSDQTHPILITTYNNIAAVHRALGDHAEALSYLSQVIAILEKQPHRDDLLLGAAYSNRASVYRAMGGYRAAVDNWEEARSIQERCLPAKHR
jgi:tetratricopeptide (TPR) repeat protein